MDGIQITPQDIQDAHRRVLRKKGISLDTYYTQECTLLRISTGGSTTKTITVNGK
jgi:hypothetical protein